MCSRDSHAKNSFGNSRWCELKMVAASSIARMKHSATKDPSAGTPGCIKNRLMLMLCNHTACSFIRGLTNVVPSLLLWSSRWRGRAHLDWSIPSLWQQYDVFTASTQYTGTDLNVPLSRMCSTSMPSFPVGCQGTGRIFQWILCLQQAGSKIRNPHGTAARPVASKNSFNCRSLWTRSRWAL